MISSTKSQGTSKHNWTTLDVFDVGDEFILEERSEHDTTRHIAETALCCVAGILLLGSYLVLILPKIPLPETYQGVSVSMVMVGIALFLYAFATRGFKPQVGFDKARKQFWICRLNSKGHARIATYFAKADVQSVFIRRPEAPSKDAALIARIRGKLGPVTLLRGRLDDIEAAHRALCEVLREVDKPAARETCPEAQLA